MKGAKIEIVRDESDFSEGDAILRLVDVFELPEKPIFRIGPLDEDASLEQQPGWPAGDLTASKMRVGTTGVEMLIDQQVVDAPALLPGTPVVITIPSASIKQELRWPSLPAVRKVQRSMVVVSAEKRRAEIAARAKARRAELESMAAVRLAAEANAAAVENEVADQSSAIAVGEGLSRLEVKRKGNMKLVASNGEPSAAPKAAMPQVAPPEPPPEQKRDEPLPMPPPPPAPFSPPVTAAALTSLVPPPLPPAIPPRVPSYASHPTPGSYSGQPPPGAFQDPPLPNFYPSMHSNPQPAPLMAPSSGRPPSLPARSMAHSHAMPASQNALANYLPAHSPRFLTRTSENPENVRTFQRAFGLGFLVAAVLALASSFALRGDVAGLLSQSSRMADLSAAAAPVTMNELSSILTLPDRSDQGASSQGANLTDALKNADQGLVGATPEEKAEAKYWLRKSLALGLGDQRLIWAMTQLGTLYAAPANGAPDYAAASTLWQLAAAQGDPIAMCFLASLYEYGLGQAQDTAQALKLYRTAKAKGGCRNVDQAIARLTKVGQ